MWMSQIVEDTSAERHRWIMTVWGILPPAIYENQVVKPLVMSSLVRQAQLGGFSG